jgi:hypothetical protein
MCAHSLLYVRAHVLLTLQLLTSLLLPTTPTARARYDLFRWLNDRAVLCACELYVKNPNSGFWSTMKPFNLGDAWHAYAHSVVEYVKNDTMTRKLKQEQLHAEATAGFYTGIVTEQAHVKDEVKGLTVAVCKLAQQMTDFVSGGGKQSAEITPEKAQTATSAAAAAASMLPRYHPGVAAVTNGEWWTDALQWEEGRRFEFYNRTPHTVPKEPVATRAPKKPLEAGAKVKQHNQWKLVKRDGDVPLAFKALLLSLHTTAQAGKMPGVHGMFHLMFRTWTTVPPGSPHPPWDILLAKVRDAASLPCCHGRAVALVALVLFSVDSILAQRFSPTSLLALSDLPAPLYICCFLTSRCMWDRYQRRWTACRTQTTRLCASSAVCGTLFSPDLPTLTVCETSSLQQTKTNRLQWAP